MDDTILDNGIGWDAAWVAACGAFAHDACVDPAQLRERVRLEGQEFWKDEAAVGHWRLDLVGARRIVVERALTALGGDARFGRDIAQRYHDELTERLQPFPDTFATLEWLRARGHRLGLITNGPREMQRDKIDRHGFEPYFDVIVIEGEFGAGKPDRRVFEHALAVTGASPADAWHVGDNLYADIGGAQAVGIHGVWIHRDRLELKDEGTTPDLVIGHLGELVAALER